jgi:hypothetical protein
MKKLILVALAALSISKTQAQVYISPVAGLNMSGYSVKLHGESSYHQDKLSNGPCIGALIDFPLKGKLGLQSGLLWSDDLVRLRLSTLDVPVRLTYSFNLHDGSKFFVGAGPYVTMNIDVHATSNLGGGGINVGFRAANGLLICLQGQYGFLNLASGSAQVHNYSFGALGGYSFKLKKHKAHAEKSTGAKQ